jgi:hypothetical protein
LSITDSFIDFFDEPNDSEGKGPGVATTEAKERTLRAQTQITNWTCFDDFWISAEKNACKQLTVKFRESSSEMLLKRHFMNIGEGRFREFKG